MSYRQAEFDNVRSCKILMCSGRIIYLVSCPDRFFSFCVGAEKKGSGGSPIHFLCSRIYNFWGSLISGDE